MSNIGNKPIIISSHINVSMNANIICITGPKGSLSLKVHYIKVDRGTKNIIIRPINNITKYKKYHGLYRTLINNMVIGVEKGFKKKLLLHGLGYRVNMEKNRLAISIGFSHIVYKCIPSELTINIMDQNKSIEIFGINKELVGLFAAQIRNIRPPEPYLGKGIRYSYEIIKKKQGKTNIK